jgi:hypothetical protein
MNLNSACCNAPLLTSHGDDGTSFYFCETCRNPADINVKAIVDKSQDYVSELRAKALAWDALYRSEEVMQSIYTQTDEESLEKESFSRLRFMDDLIKNYSK